jgi:predicted O-linked N-acetylglucosamine transferase (SPINDLY family)
MTTVQPPALPLAQLQQLFALFNARRYAEMETLACALLQRWPDAGPGWKALSVALQAQGKNALDALQRAMVLLPDDADLPSNLGSLLSDAGRLDEAIACFRRALEILPNFAEAHGNLGLALTRVGRPDEAVASLQRAVQLKPAFTEAHHNLGNALVRLQRFDEAAASYRRTLALNPNHAQAHAGLGVVLQGLGRLGEAVASYRSALALRPEMALVHFNLGHVLLALGQTPAAAASLRHAVELSPTHAAAHNDLGLALLALGHVDDAIACYRRALALEPAATAVLNNLANALRSAGQVDEAIAGYQRALGLRPDELLTLGNLGSAWRELGRMDEAAGCYRRIVEIEPDHLGAYSDLLFIDNYRADRPAQELLAAARDFGTRAAARARPYTCWPGRPEAGRRLRVGLVSGDFRAHPVSYFLQSVLDALAGPAAEHLELFAYSNSSVSDAATDQLRTSFGHWRSIWSLSDEAAAAQIHRDGIDILIDLSGHTAGNRLPLFAWKPAPVQLGWLGYCATTGLGAIDHVLVDPWIAPSAVQAQFSEKLWRLPESFLCFSPPRPELPVTPLPALATGRLTFGCFNKLNKLNDAVLALWAELLRAVPGSRLCLKARPLDAPDTSRRLLRRFEQLGIASERLSLAGASSRTDYLAAYQHIDIALDPFPYPGGTTSVEGLWMGVPLLSLAGDRPLARQGVSILHNVGLPDWIASDTDDYLARAVRHAADIQGLAALRAELRPRLLASPLCDAPRFARHFEQALRAIWASHCEQHAGR